MTEEEEEELNKIIRLQEDFWNNKYPNMNRDEKIPYWTTYIHHDMRVNGEEGDPYDAFSKE